MADDASSSLASTKENRQPLAEKGGKKSSLKSNNRSDSNFLENVMESVVKITLAGFGGSMVGLGLQRQQQLQKITAKNNNGTNNGLPLPKRPPVGRTARSVAQMNLPATWAISCMVFAGILESSRQSSPTTVLLQKLSQENIADETFPSSSSFLFDREVRFTTLRAVGDYTLGGTVAGLAGAFAQRRKPFAVATGTVLRSSRAGQRPWSAWGLAAGMALGFLGGVVQAAIDVGGLYLQREQNDEHSR